VNGGIPRSNYAKFYRRTHDGVIHVYDKTGNVIETRQNSNGDLAQR
jgi:hypothetical protein